MKYLNFAVNVANFSKINGFAKNAICVEDVVDVTDE